MTNTSLFITQVLRSLGGSLRVSRTSRVSQGPPLTTLGPWWRLSPSPSLAPSASLLCLWWVMEIIMSSSSQKSTILDKKSDKTESKAQAQNSCEISCLMSTKLHIFVKKQLRKTRSNMPTPPLTLYGVPYKFLLCP